MSTLTQASQQWASRPNDERFLSLIDMAQHFALQREHSQARVMNTRQIEFIPTEDNKGLLAAVGGTEYNPTHFSFNQLCSLAESPAGFLRKLPSPYVADVLNYQMRFGRDVDDVGLLMYRNGSDELRAATGPRYGRIWNNDILEGMTRLFGDGRTGDWRVPGEFGVEVEITKKNTTLYAGDRDMFVFLADEKNRIELPNRRDGKTGLMARGFFIWNSEVGSSTFGVSTFLFDYVCQNRIVWGAEDVKEIKLRHTSSAPVKFLEEIQPALMSYANSSTANIVTGIQKAQAARLDNVDDFLANRYGKRMVQQLKTTHELEEGRPIESLWDVSVAVTARARGIQYQDERVEIERDAGAVIRLAL